MACSDDNLLRCLLTACLVMPKWSATNLVRSFGCLSRCSRMYLRTSSPLARILFVICNLTLVVCQNKGLVLTTLGPMIVNFKKIIVNLNEHCLARRAQILGPLVEDSSLGAAASRLADCSINTVSKLLIDVGVSSSVADKVAGKAADCWTWIGRSNVMQIRMIRVSVITGNHNSTGLRSHASKPHAGPGRQRLEPLERLRLRSRRCESFRDGRGRGHRAALRSSERGRSCGSRRRATDSPRRRGHG